MNDTVQDIVTVLPRLIEKAGFRFLMVLGSDTTSEM